jgi:hypothetical protein
MLTEKQKQKFEEIANKALTDIGIASDAIRKRIVELYSDFYGEIKNVIHESDSMDLKSLVGDDADEKMEQNIKELKSLVNHDKDMLAKIRKAIDNNPKIKNFVLKDLFDKKGKDQIRQELIHDEKEFSTLSLGMLTSVLALIDNGSSIGFQMLMPALRLAKMDLEAVKDVKKWPESLFDHGGFGLLTADDEFPCKDESSSEDKEEKTDILEILSLFRRG